MQTLRQALSLLSLVLLLGLASTPSLAVGPAIGKDTRCAVCGMFVAKYPNWIVKAILTNGEVTYFDGVKDAMVFFFSPQKYGVKPGVGVERLMVNDYYSLQPVEAKTAFFVVGSDVTGPMGHELIPFAAKEAAESFRTDHHGKEVLPFGSITPELVEGLRAGSRMK